MDTISTSTLIRVGDSQGGTTKMSRRSIDFIVNGLSLFKALNAEQFDMCGRFSAETPDWNRQSVRAFLLEGDPDFGLENGRFMLFVCSECGDLACGAITCRIRKDGDNFIWDSFAYENGYDPELTDFSSYVSIGPFCFSSEMYRRALAEAA